VALVSPDSGAAPLPQEWDGPVATAGA
jgi:uncharacterized protein